MGKDLRRARIVAVGVLLSTGLAGCTLFSSGPARDAAGQVTAAAEIAASELAVGDCFSFLDGGTSDVTVTPCADDHSLVVLAQGALSQAQIDEADGLQNAVSLACTEKYDVFAASLAEGLRSELSFLVHDDEVEGKKVTAYSCVAVDPVAEELEAPAES